MSISITCRVVTGDCIGFAVDGAVSVTVHIVSNGQVDLSHQSGRSRPLKGRLYFGTGDGSWFSEACRIDDHRSCMYFTLFSREIVNACVCAQRQQQGRVQQQQRQNRLKRSRQDVVGAACSEDLQGGSISSGLAGGHDFAAPPASWHHSNAFDMPGAFCAWHVTSSFDRFAPWTLELLGAPPETET